jgi:hypothetical protein
MRGGKQPLEPHVGLEARRIGEPDYVWQGAQDIANDMFARGYAEWQAAGG